MTKSEAMSGHLEPESPSALVSDARASEIRGYLSAKHGALWMHYYHREIEAEVLRILQGNIDSPPGVDHD